MHSFLETFIYFLIASKIYQITDNLSFMDFTSASEEFLELTKSALLASLEGWLIIVM